MNASRLAAAALLLAAALPGGAAPGASVVIYRCVAADGAVTLQNGKKCPKGMREQKRVMAAPAAPATPARVVQANGVPADAGVPAASAGRATPPGATPDGAGSGAAPVQAAAASANVTDAAAGATTARLPPPLLYACLTRDAQRYFGDEAESTRCAPLNAVALDGRSPGAGEACEVVRDRCEPVPEAERCAAWAERRQVAERALTFVPEQVDAARAELDRIDAAVAGTACAR